MQEKGISKHDGNEGAINILLKIQISMTLKIVYRINVPFMQMQNIL